MFSIIGSAFSLQVLTPMTCSFHYFGLLTGSCGHWSWSKLSWVLAPDCRVCLCFGSRKSSTRVLNCIQTEKGSQWKEPWSEVVWENLGRLNTRCAETFWTGCRNLVAETGVKPVCTHTCSAKSPLVCMFVMTWLTLDWPLVVWYFNASQVLLWSKRW